MVETIRNGSEYPSQKNELDAWRASAAELDNIRIEIGRLVGLQNSAASKQNELTENFLRRFSSTLLSIKPNIFAMIKPSKRQNIDSSFPIGSTISFREKDGRVVVLNENVDYQIIDFSPSKTWTTGSLDEHRDWLIEVMTELDTSEYKI